MSKVGIQGLTRRLFLVVIVLSYLFIVNSSCSSAYAKANMLNLLVQEPFNNLNMHCMQQHIRLISAETICHHGLCLPKGTVFEGQISQIKKSHRFLRPGLLKLELNRALFPEGYVVVFERAIQIDIRHKDVLTAKTFIWKLLLDIIPDLATDVVLNRTTHLSELSRDAISLAPDFTMDFALECKYPTVPHESKLKRAAFALLDATYIPFIISFVRKDKTIALVQGDIIVTGLSPKEFRALLAQHPEKVTARHYFKILRLKGEISQ